MNDVSQVEALLFDVFGTVVDWRSGVIRELETFGASKGLSLDWALLADEWRGLYQPAMEEIRTGRRPWTILDILHRENLETVLARHGLRDLTEEDKDELTRAWHRLPPWPDTVAGLTRLKQKFIIGTLSNGNVGLMTRLAKNAGLPWDVILGAEVARAYKPQPEAYRRSAEILTLPRHKVMLVAAHSSDLAAAAKEGLCTGFVARPREYGPAKQADVATPGDWDIVADSFTSLADALGCP